MVLQVEKDGFRVGTCKLCGAKILWASREEGGRIPLDPVAPTFAVSRFQADAVARRFQKNAAGDTILVSHFSTCPAKTRAHKLLHDVAAAFRQSGAGVYPPCEEAAALMRSVHAHLGIDGP